MATHADGTAGALPDSRAEATVKAGGEAAGRSLVLLVLAGASS